MFCRWTLILIFLLSISCCSHQRPASPPNTPQTGVIRVIENHKYNLEAVFSGYDLEVGERTVKVIDSLTIRSRVTGQEVKYERADGPSTSDAHAYFTDVWSPDEELLVLPLNRFYGFCIIRASEALDSIQRQKCADFVRVRNETPPKEAFGHDFEKWDGNESFVFKAGLYGDDTRLRYEISSGRLTALDSNLRDIEGENGKGKIAIKRGL
jgi:hypothetical protein